MSGVYGTIKPADINIEKDVEVFYHYRPSLNIDDTDFMDFKQGESKWLTPCKFNKDNEGVNISGLFNLKLPMDIFGKKGIYTIYIKPKEKTYNISDIGTLAPYPDVRGVVFNSLEDEFKSSNALVGYRIEYLDNNGKKTGDFKIITSSHRAEPVAVSLNNTTSKGVKYVYNTKSSSVFCTITPSIAPTYKPNDLPFLGNPGEQVILVNTKFNPIMLELDMVEHDAETIGTFLTGDQLVDKDNALITTFNKDGEIITQSEYGVYKDAYGNPLYEYRKEKPDIDFTQNMEGLE